jgi:integrase
MSIWDDKQGRKHIGIMVSGARIHRILPQGTSAGDAKRIEAELRGAIIKQPKQVVIPGDPSMALVLAVYMQHAQTLRGTAHAEQAAKRLGPWAEKYKASQAREFAAHFVKDTIEAYAPATINRSLACAKKGLALCWEQNITPDNYGLRIKPLKVNNKREVFLTVEQVQKITQHCTDQAKAAIWAALLTGARRGELFKIRAEHIHADTITVPASHTKTMRSRVIPIVPALRPWLAHFPLTITVDGIKSAWRRARVKAELEHVNFHDLRHSCASIMLGLGVDLYTIGKILGHSNTQTTQRYAHLQIEQQRNALDKLSALVTG